MSQNYATEGWKVGAQDVFLCTQNAAKDHLSIFPTGVIVHAPSNCLDVSLIFGKDQSQNSSYDSESDSEASSAGSPLPSKSTTIDDSSDDSDFSDSSPGFSRKNSNAVANTMKKQKKQMGNTSPKAKDINSIDNTIVKPMKITSRTRTYKDELIARDLPALSNQLTVDDVVWHACRNNASSRLGDFVAGSQEEKLQNLVNKKIFIREKFPLLRESSMPTMIRALYMEPEHIQMTAYEFVAFKEFMRKLEELNNRRVSRRRTY